MQLDSAMNKDQWISHLACSENDFNLVFTHPRKSNATKIVREELKIIQTRFNATIVFFRTDGEKSLGKEFDEMISDLGITYEPSAPYTPEPNDHLERKGGVLAMKARAMRIQASLPKYLWPWIARAAGFIMNRTPMTKHSWKTPFERVTSFVCLFHLLHLLHLLQFLHLLHLLRLLISPASPASSASCKSELRRRNASLQACILI